MKTETERDPRLDPKPLDKVAICGRSGSDGPQLIRTVEYVSILGTVAYTIDGRLSQNHQCSVASWRTWCKKNHASIKRRAQLQNDDWARDREFLSLRNRMGPLPLNGSILRASNNEITLALVDLGIAHLTHHTPWKNHTIRLDDVRDLIVKRRAEEGR